MTISEIKDAICGVGEDGTRKALVTIGTHLQNIIDDTADSEIVMEFSSDKPIVEIVLNGHYFMVDLKFNSGKDPDLAQFYRCLERYRDLLNDSPPEKLPTSTLTLIPFELEGRYYVSGIMPAFWSLMPDRVGGDTRILRLVYDDNLFSFAENDEDEDDIDAEVQRRMDMRMTEGQDEDGSEDEPISEKADDEIFGADEQPSNPADMGDEDDEDKYYKGGTYE